MYGEDDFLEAQYEDANGGEVDTATEDEEEDECLCADVDPWVGYHENPECPFYKKED